jgi:hypothetical protein
MLGLGLVTLLVGLFFLSSVLWMPTTFCSASNGGPETCTTDTGAVLTVFVLFAAGLLISGAGTYTTWRHW